MALATGYLLPKITDPAKFESLVRDCALAKLNGHYILYGRRGQNQHGIDIYNSDVDTVIQCKNYIAANIKALQTAVDKDYQDAVDYFSTERQLPLKKFIVATAADRDAAFQDYVNEKNRENPIKIEILFWEDITEIVLKHPEILKTYFGSFVIDASRLKMVHTDNETYAIGFSEPLFLHKDPPNPRVSLCHLFVMPKYRENEQEKPKTDMPDILRQFVRSDKKFLFIEGDAGCGKSTLVSWINYHAAKPDDDESKCHLFDHSPVITIRLRDLDKDIIRSNNSLRQAILTYMNLSQKELIHRFPHAVMILDGFDELCMIDGISDFERLLYDLYIYGFSNYHYIIMSRPKYIQKGINNIPAWHITLQHFDEEKRKEWIDHYTSDGYCGQALDEEIQNYILHITDEEDSVICDTPMTLYLLAAKRIKPDMTKNSWVLYHQIFYRALSETEYNRMYSDESIIHPVWEYQDILYMISEEVAFRMYQTGNKRLFVSEQELEEILLSLSERNRRLRDDAVKTTVERCYAICNYWKETGDGAAEFYHNNIRDFFLCEKIYREMNAIYTNNRLDKAEKIRQLIIFLKQLKKLSLDEMVCRFILLRARQEVNDRSSFVCREKQERLLPDLFEEMLTNGRLYDDLQESTHIQAIINILSSAAKIYRHIYEPLLQEKKSVRWWHDVGKINAQSDVIRYCFKDIFFWRFRSENSTNGSDRMDASDLDMMGCSLPLASFRYADLRVANLRGADLRGADLRGANLSGAGLRGADLRDADLRFAALPDGFTGKTQEEQIQHLKAIEIPGLKI